MKIYPVSYHFLLILGLSFGSGTIGNADTVIANTADAHIRKAGAGDGGGIVTSNLTTNFLGRGSSSDSSVVVMPFLLPTLLPGQSFANATLSFTSNGLNSGTSLSVNVDLYGLGNRSSATVVSDDYYVGADTTTYDPTDATLIKENMISSGTAAPGGTIFSTNVPALTTYLNSNSTTAAGTRYVFLRVGTDVAYTTNRIDIRSATYDGEPNKPTLTFDIVTSGLSNYDNWAMTTHSLSGGSAAFDYDFENDGIANGLEWVLGGDPKQSDSSILPQSVGAASTGLTLVFSRLAGSQTETALSVDWGGDLASLTNSIPIGDVDVPASGDAPTVDIDAPVPGKVTVNIPSANAAGGNVFARLKLIQIP